MRQVLATAGGFSISQLIELNLYEYFTHVGKSSNVYSCHPQGEILFSGVDHPLFNWAYNLSIHSKEDIDLLKKRFLGKPSTWITIDSEGPEIRETLEKNGMSHIATNECMFVDLTQPFPTRAKPRGLEIVKVQSQQHYLMWCELSSMSFLHEPRMCDGVMKGFPKGIDATGNLHLFIALLDGRPVGGCSLYFGKHVAGNYWGSVHPNYRRQGIATQMALLRMELALKQGYDRLVVQASGDARLAFENLGFQSVGNVYLYSIKS